MTRRPAPLRLLLPALLIVLAGCGGSAETEQVAAAAPVCAAPAAAPEPAAPAAAGVPRPVDARDDRELGELTPEQAELVQQLHEAEQAPAEHDEPAAEAAPADAHAEAPVEHAEVSAGVAPADAHAVAATPAEATPAPPAPCTPAAEAPAADAADAAHAGPSAGGH